MTEDALLAAIKEATAGLSSTEAARFESLVQDGLRTMDGEQAGDDLAAEIRPARTLPPAKRLAWAREFAVKGRVSSLNQRAWRLIQAYRTGSRPQADLRREAAALQDELNAVDLSELSADARRRQQKLLGEAKTECRYILSDGKGPTSLRAAN